MNRLLRINVKSSELIEMILEVLKAQPIVGELGVPETALDVVHCYLLPEN